VANFPLCRSLSAVALAKADALVAEKLVQKSTLFRIFLHFFSLFCNFLRFLAFFTHFLALFCTFYLAYFA